jgi:hypothetical protein
MNVESKSRRGFPRRLFCVPSTIDSLEAEVLHPAWWHAKDQRRAMASWQIPGNPRASRAPGFYAFRFRRDVPSVTPSLMAF